MASGLNIRPPVEFPTSTLIMAAEAEAARASAASDWKNISTWRDWWKAKASFCDVEEEGEGERAAKKEGNGKGGIYVRRGDGGYEERGREGRTGRKGGRGMKTGKQGQNGSPVLCLCSVRCDREDVDHARFAVADWMQETEYQSDVEGPRDVEFAPGPGNKDQCANMTVHHAVSLCTVLAVERSTSMNSPVHISWCSLNDRCRAPCTAVFLFLSELTEMHAKMQLCQKLRCQSSEEETMKISANHSDPIIYCTQRLPHQRLWD